MEKIQNYIDGRFVAPTNNAYFDNIEPATGQVYCLIPDSDAQDVELAVEAANSAFPLWSNMTNELRS